MGWPKSKAVFVSAMAAPAGAPKTRIAARAILSGGIANTPVGANAPGLDAIIVIECVYAALLHEFLPVGLHIPGLIRTAAEQNPSLAVPLLRCCFVMCAD